MSAHDKHPPPQLAEFLQQHGVREVECLIPDLNAYPRGKALPAAAFAAGQELRMARAVAIHTVTGEFPDYRFYGERDPDMRLVPDYETLKLVPWATEPRALVINDCVDLDGKPTAISSRNILKSVLARYEERGWSPVVAPELEFYLLAQNPDPNQPLTPPVGRSGRPEYGQAGFSFGALNEFHGFFDDVHRALADLGIPGDTFVHELGPSQFEINLVHGDALKLADLTFLFKYTLREIGFRHGLYVVFMAKPMGGKPGSSMHLHQSVVDRDGRNIFSKADGEPSDAFYHFIGGLQHCLPELMPLLCPHINSYRRFAKHMAAPVNLSWGYDNRSVGLRIPLSGPAARRVENRIPGCDANPYLALAASLASGLYGIDSALPAGEEAHENVFYQESCDSLPCSLEVALSAMQHGKIARELFGDEFVNAFVAAKQVELDSFQLEVTPWERRFLATQA